MRRAISPRVLVVAVLLILGVMGTAARLRVWQSERTLWTATQATDPTDARVLINLAAEALRRQDLTAAAAWLDQADVVAPLAPDPRVAVDYIRGNRVSLFLREGRYVEARQLVRSSPPQSLARRFCPQYPTLALCEGTP